MVLVVIFVATLIMVCVAAFWPDMKHAALCVRHKRVARTTPTVTPQPIAPETLEGALVRQVIAGEISTAQYRRAMGAVAARDAVRHPVYLPPDLDPPGKHR